MNTVPGQAEKPNGIWAAILGAVLGRIARPVRRDSSCVRVLRLFEKRPLNRQVKQQFTYINLRNSWDKILEPYRLAIRLLFLYII